LFFNKTEQKKEKEHKTKQQGDRVDLDALNEPYLVDIDALRIRGVRGEPGEEEEVGTLNPEQGSAKKADLVDIDALRIRIVTFSLERLSLLAVGRVGLGK
jgi:hypothetical protein